MGTRKHKKRATPEERIAKMYACKNHKDCKLAPLMATCANCRLGVESAQARAYMRHLRAMKRDPACSSTACLKFLDSVTDTTLRSHLTAMAWWRFSLDLDDPNRKILTSRMREAASCDIPFGTEYMHTAIKTLAPLSSEQLCLWFGHETPYQMVEFYSDYKTEGKGIHCDGCALYSRGCTSYASQGAHICPFWKDDVVQSVIGRKPKIDKESEEYEDDEGYSAEDGPDASCGGDGDGGDCGCGSGDTGA